MSVACGWISHERRQVAESRRIFAPRILDRGEQPRWRFWLFGDDPVRHAITIDGWELRDHDLVHLSRCVGLRRLYLNATSISDAGMRHLASLTTITDLELNHTNVTDAGLVYLKRLSRLETLNVEGTDVTASCLEQMRRYWPEARIHSSH